MKYPKLFLTLIFGLPWLTTPLLGKDTFKRFLPAAVFISLLVELEGRLARKRKWWWIYERIHPKLPGILPLIWGPFLIGSIWILKLTYGKFRIYSVLNLIIDSGFTYVLTEWFKKMGIASLVRLKKYQLSILFFVKSLLLYGFQYLMEDGLRRK